MLKIVRKLIQYGGGVAGMTAGFLLFFWLFHNDIDFGEGTLGIITKQVYLWGMVTCFCLGMTIGTAFTKGHLKSIKNLIGTFWVLFGIVAFSLWGATAIYGVPMDASYSFGVNALLIVKAGLMSMTLVIMVIAIIAFTMLKGAENLFRWLWVILILIGFLFLNSFAANVIEGYFF